MKGSFFVWLLLCIPLVRGGGVWNCMKKALKAPKISFTNMRKCLGSGEAATTEAPWKVKDGIAPGDRLHRIYQGHVSRRWPHHAGLCYDGKLICGASLITSAHVVTAAHCMQDVSPLLDFRNPSVLRKLKIKLGAHRIDAESCSSDFSPSEQLISVREVVLHPEFGRPLQLNIKDDGYRFSNDVAVLKLSKRARIDDDVAPVRLQHRTLPVMPGEDCRIMGWGYTEGRRRFSEVLKEAKVRVLPHRDCIRLYGTDHIDTSLFCAGSIGAPGPNSCRGDSGGAMVCKRGDEWVLAGVTAFGRNCNMANSTGVYVNMDRVLGFIAHTVRPSAAITDLKVISGHDDKLCCPKGYTQVPQNLQGISPQFAYGRGRGRKTPVMTFLCFKRKEESSRFITNMTLVVGTRRPRCPEGFHRTATDLRKGLGPPYLYICYERSRSEGSKPVVDIVSISRYWQFENEKMPLKYKMLSPPVAMDYSKAIFLAFRQGSFISSSRYSRSRLVF